MQAEERECGCGRPVRQCEQIRTELGRGKSAYAPSATVVTAAPSILGTVVLPHRRLFLCTGNFVFSCNVRVSN